MQSLAALLLLSLANLNHLLWGYITSPFCLALYIFLFTLCCPSCYSSSCFFFPGWVTVLPGLLHSSVVIHWDVMTFYIFNPRGFLYVGSQKHHYAYFRTQFCWKVAGLKLYKWTSLALGCLKLYLCQRIVHLFVIFCTLSLIFCIMAGIILWF